jgi:LysR family transcriptional regulator, nitrogen assimilation regulatory protein
MADIRKLRSFVAVYETGGISKAAQREHVAQPALTVHIRQLESEFNAKLFERSAQGVRPTPAGAACYARCLDLLKRLDALGEHMREFSGEVAGALSAGIMPSICHGPLASMLTRYTSAYPNVEVRIVEGLSGTLADWVRAGQVDFAVCNRPASAHGLELSLLLQDNLVLVSARGSGAKAFAPCRLSEMRKLKLVLPSRQHSLRATLDQCIQRGECRPLQTLEIDGQSATLQFVAHSDWSTILPRIALVNEFDSVRFTLNPIRAPEMTTELYALRAAKHHLSAAGERFIAMLAESLRGAPQLPSPRAVTAVSHRARR